MDSICGRNGTKRLTVYVHRSEKVFSKTHHYCVPVNGGDRRMLPALPVWEEADWLPGEGRGLVFSSQHPSNDVVFATSRRQTTDISGQIK